MPEPTDSSSDGANTEFARQEKIPGLATLFEAAKLDYHDMLRVLIQLSSIPELRYDALIIVPFDAASKSHTEVVELIVATGALIEARNSEGFTPLQASVLDGNEDIMKFSLLHGGQCGSSI